MHALKQFRQSVWVWAHFCLFSSLYHLEPNVSGRSVVSLAVFFLVYPSLCTLCEVCSPDILHSKTNRGKQSKTNKLNWAQKTANRKLENAESNKKKAKQQPKKIKRLFPQLGTFDIFCVILLNENFVMKLLRMLIICIWDVISAIHLTEHSLAHARRWILLSFLLSIIPFIG